MLRRSLDQIGGRYAITFWAWLVTLPLTVLVSSVYASPPSLRDIAVWTSTLIAIHIAIGALMLLAWLTVLPSRPRRARPLTAIFVFASLGLTRALLLSWMQDVTGLGAFEPGERISFNVAASVVLYSAIAIVIDEYRTDAAITRRLASARATLSALREREATELQTADEQILRQVRDQLEGELRAEDVDARRLRVLSEAVVRSVSHELAEPVSSSAVLSDVDARSSRWHALGSTVGRMTIPPALAVMVPLEVLIFWGVAARYGLPFSLINSAMGAAPTVVGLWALRRFLPLPRQPLMRLVTITVSVSVLSAATSAVNLWTAAFFVDDFVFSLPAVAAGVTGLALVVSWWIAASEGRAARQENLADVVAEEAQEVARLQALLNERRMAAARFLHGTVQNELVAASLRGDSVDAVQAKVSQAFDSYGASTPGEETRSVLESLLRSWSVVLEITTSIDDAAWQDIAIDSTRGTLLIDVVSEALTNAVRHSQGRAITIVIDHLDGALHVRIVTAGAPRDVQSEGIGLQDLRYRGADIALTAEEDMTVLSALLR